MSDFYDRMASLYDLIFQDWNESIDRQAEQLSSIVKDRRRAESKYILEVSCGIGSQAIGLAKHDFVVTGSDLSATATSQAKAEVMLRAVARFRAAAGVLCNKRKCWTSMPLPPG